MTNQILTFRPGKPLFISTPLGLITLERVEEDRGPGRKSDRKVRFTLPPGCKAFVGDKPEMRKGEMVVATGPGALKPKFSLLAPITNERGELIGVEIPKTLMLEEQSDDGEEAILPGCKAFVVAKTEGS